MIYYKCDICKKEMAKRPYRTILDEALLKSETDLVLDGKPFKKIDFCRDCYSDFLHYLDAKKKECNSNDIISCDHK